MAFASNGVIIISKQMMNDCVLPRRWCHYVLPVQFSDMLQQLNT